MSKMKRKQQKNSETRMVAYVGFDTYVPDHGYRVSFVKEGQSGHCPTGDWPYTAEPGQILPWFWGPSLEDAQAQMTEYNRRMGIEPEEANRIVLESIALQLRTRTRRKRSKKRGG